MIDKLNTAEISSRVDLPDGGAVVLLDRLGKSGRYNKEELARNILRINIDGNIQWTVRSQFDVEGNPFTRLHFHEGSLTAYRWDGGSYGIDVETGVATPLVLER